MYFCLLNASSASPAALHQMLLLLPRLFPLQRSKLPSLLVLLLFPLLPSLLLLVLLPLQRPFPLPSLPLLLLLPLLLTHAVSSSLTFSPSPAPASSLPPSFFLFPYCLAIEIFTPRLDTLAFGFTSSFISLPSSLLPCPCPFSLLSPSPSLAH